jgi:hypothetical protein
MYTDVDTKSWGSRIGGALTGVLLGIILIPVSFYAVFWNESHGLHTAQSLQQTEKMLISIPISPLNPNNDMKPVYLTGVATTNDKLTDADFGLSENAIKLNRQVLMYQWEEHENVKTEKEVGGSEKETRTYDYQPVWSEKLIQSNQFKEVNGHETPAVKPMESLYQSATNVTLGDFTLSPDLVKSINGESQLEFSTYDPSKLQARLNKSVQHVNDYFYIGASAQTPAVGDLKVFIHEVKPQTVSVIAAQSGHTLQPYLAPAGQTVGLVAMGEVPVSVMIHDAEAENQLLTWVWRFCTLLAMIIGVSLIMRPIVVLADFIPFFGSLVGFGTGLIALVCGLFLWGSASAIAWFVVRPVWAVGIMVIVILLGYFLVHSRKNTTAVKS